MRIEGKNFGWMCFLLLAIWIVSLNDVAHAGNLSSFYSSGSSSIPSMISAESSSTYTVAGAAGYCRSLNAACQYTSNGSTCGATTYTGWRLPTADELRIFVGLGTSDNLWTGSVYYGSNGNFVYYELSSGGWSNYFYYANTCSAGNYVRCVR